MQNAHGPAAPAIKETVLCIRFVWREVDPKQRIARVHIGAHKKIPGTAGDAGKSFYEMVAGAGFEHQKTPFPPVDVVEMAFVRKGSTLVPVAA